MSLSFREFNPDETEIKIKLENIYNECIEKLRDLNDDGEETAEVNMTAKVYIDIWEAQKKIYQDYIESILQENVSLKNEIRSIKCQLKLYREKSKDILNMNSDREEGFDKFYIETPRSNLKFDSHNSIMSIVNTTPMSIIKTDSDEISLNLNRIRDILNKNNSVIKFQRNKVKRSLSLGSKVKIKVTNQENLYIQNTTVTPAHSLVTIPKNKKETILDQIPRLMPLEFVSKCTSCLGSFGICRWKYHCRVCGDVYCNICSNQSDSFIPYYLDRVRICNDCHTEKKNIIAK